MIGCIASYRLLQFIQALCHVNRIAKHTGSCGRDLPLHSAQAILHIRRQNSKRRHQWLPSSRSGLDCLTSISRTEVQRYRCTDVLQMARWASWPPNRIDHGLDPHDVKQHVGKRLRFTPIRAGGGRQEPLAFCRLADDKLLGCMWVLRLRLSPSTSSYCVIENSLKVLLGCHVLPHMVSVYYARAEEISKYHPTMRATCRATSAHPAGCW